MTEAELTEIADFIRSKSKAGELATSAHLEAEFGDSDPDSATGPAWSFIQDVMLSHDDIKAVQDINGNRFYYSELSMSGGYAGVLVLKTEGPLRMVAEVIRDHSRIYPRPVPVTLFQCSPFNLTEDQIVLVLNELAQEASYRDLAQVTTSIGSVFAYSTDYLDRDYAAMLAEWLDVGQGENP